MHHRVIFFYRVILICKISVKLDGTFTLESPSIWLSKTFSPLFLFFFFPPETFNLSYPLASAYMNWWLNKLRIGILFCSSKTCIYCCDLSDNLHKVLVSTAEIIKSSENEMFNCFHSSRQFFHIDMQELHRSQFVFWMKNASLMLILRKSLYCIPI